MRIGVIISAEGCLSVIERRVKLGNSFFADACSAKVAAGCCAGEILAGLEGSCAKSCVSNFSVSLAFSLASLCSFVINLIFLTAVLGCSVTGPPTFSVSKVAFFMLEVKASISGSFELESSTDGSIMLEDLDGGKTGGYSWGAVLDSFSGDFRRAREILGGSFRGCGGALVFFTTTGGMEWPRELMEESGLMLCDVLGRVDMDGSPLDAILLRP